MKSPEMPFAADDERWARAFAKLGMAGALTDAGYGELAEGLPDAETGGGLLARARARLGGRA